MSRVRTALEELARSHGVVYQAAQPGYPQNFTRDSLTYGILAGDALALKAQIEYSAERQGVDYNPETGEEPGKIHHEWPGVTMRGLQTTYNACDTTALFLQSIARMVRQGHDRLLDTHRGNIERALKYITSHLMDGVFYEDPEQCGAERFALKVTYWKDSELQTAEKEPIYPIAYSLVHFQNKAAVQEMGHVLERRDLEDLAERMTKRGVEEFWSEDHFVVAKEGSGRVIDPVSSDSLHTLLYLEPHEIADKYPIKIIEYSRQLATQRGYLPVLDNRKGRDPYHTDYIWVHEQALLHAAARRHRLAEAETVASRIIPILEAGFPELANPRKNFAHAGNPTQLWAIGAHLYFERLKVEIILGSQIGAAHEDEETS